MNRTLPSRGPRTFAALLLAGALVSTSAHAATLPKPLPHRGGIFTQKEGKIRLSGYLSLPKGAGTHPGIVAIQEWWGLDDWVKAQADSLAAHGYVVLAPDLYAGRVAYDQETAHQLMSGLVDEDVMAILRAAVDHLRSREDVRAQAIGVIGWCMGGGYALDFTVAEPRLAASVINYGHLMVDPKTIASIKPPILGNFGAEDRGIPPADVKAFEQILKQTGHDVDIKIYEGAGHAFENPNNTQGYVPAAAADAQSRTDAFLAKHLGR